MFDGPGIFYGAGGITVVILGAAIYLAVLLLTLWIFYMIIRAAVTNGILRAARQGAFRSAPQQHYPPQSPPQQHQGGPYGP